MSTGVTFNTALSGNDETAQHYEPPQAMAWRVDDSSTQQAEAIAGREDASEAGRPNMEL